MREATLPTAPRVDPAVLGGSPPSIHTEGYEDDRKNEATLNGSAWTLTPIDNTPPLQGRKLTVEFAKGKGCCKSSIQLGKR